MATPAEVSAQLAASSLAADVATALVAEASGLWFLSASAETLVADLAHCHPPLAPGEVRAAFRPTSSEARVRLTVVAHDRAGLLAVTAGVLALRGVSVASASVSTWDRRALALHGLTVVDADDRGRSQADWDGVAEEIRDAHQQGLVPAVQYTPARRVTVVCSPAALGCTLVTIEAPDRVGLLWGIASWFADNGMNIEAAELAEEVGRAKDLFLVTGNPDPERLAAHLTSRGTGRRRARWWRARLGHPNAATAARQQ